MFEVTSKRSVKGILSIIFMVAFVGCSNSKDEPAAGGGADTATLKKNTEQLGNLSDELANLKTIKEKDNARIKYLEDKINAKRNAGNLSSTNLKSVKQMMDGHTTLYKLKGLYKVMVIPVQFSDKKFADAEYLTNELQSDLFDPSNDRSLRTYFRHASFGVFDVDGVVTEPVTVKGTIEDYGKALAGGTNDVNARGLVQETLLTLREQKKSTPEWWDQFDRWDLYDYDQDKNFYEPDGFIDAVILVYAGKSQASCQASFSVDGKKVGTDEFPQDDPRHGAAVECFNRIWPHRWVLSLGADDPDYTGKVGPMVEGQQRHSLNGLKITDRVYARDYNMQSEFSDLSTFMHEFGHSITLPDIYARGGGGNSVGSWELMANNAGNLAQELSSYTKLALGWIQPKVIQSKQASSFYLGSYNFVTEKQRNSLGSYEGPEYVTEENLVGKEVDVSIISKTNGFGEPVYRSALVATPASKEKLNIIKFPKHVGTTAAYSSRYDGEERGISRKILVPKSGSAVVSFDTAYNIETETNFMSKAPDVKVTTIFDVGEVRVNGKPLENFILISGDNNLDSLNETDPNCKAARVLELRRQYFADGTSEDQKAKIAEEFQPLYNACKVPSWLNKKYDLSEFRGQEVLFEIVYRTDPGYTEIGMVVDNIKVGETLIDDFEDGGGVDGFVALENGIHHQEHHQFYLMEYRDPISKYEVDGKEASFNMDTHINQGSQSMFLEGGSVLDNFRMVTMDYQPGLVVWYFNSKYDTISNNPEDQAQLGKGYLLVVNSKVKTVPIPGVFSNEKFFDENGHYKSAKKDEAFKAFVDTQRETLACFGYTKYWNYLKGKEADCSGIDPQYIDYMPKLTFEGKELIYRREGFNNVLPKDRFDDHGVGMPYRNSVYARTGLSTFRPKEMGNFAPFKIYKAVEGQMVLDEELTGAENNSYEPVSSYKDVNAKIPEYKPHVPDSVLVEKVGFGFNVATPGWQGLEGYNAAADPDSNDFIMRQPKVKVYLKWEHFNAAAEQAEASATRAPKNLFDKHLRLHKGKHSLQGHSCSSHGAHAH